MWAEYFAIFGVLFASYCVFRTLIWGQYKMDFRPFSTGKVSDHACRPIDASALSHRLQEVRQSSETRPRHTSASFKQSVLVEISREKLARASYFQKPPPPEAPDEEHGLNLLLV
jgi:hypothetical protein